RPRMHEMRRRELVLFDISQDRLSFDEWHRLRVRLGNWNDMVIALAWIDVPPERPSRCAHPAGLLRHFVSPEQPCYILPAAPAEPIRQRRFGDRVAGAHARNYGDRRYPARQKFGDLPFDAENGSAPFDRDGGTTMDEALVGGQRQHQPAA